MKESFAGHLWWLKFNWTLEIALQGKDWSKTHYVKSTVLAGYNQLQGNHATPPMQQSTVLNHISHPMLQTSQACSFSISIVAVLLLTVLTICGPPPPS